MSKRYGRNQRRKHRAEIAALKSSYAAARNAATANAMEAERARYMLRNAQSEAFQDFIRATGLFESALNRMAEEIGRVAGERYRDEIRSMMHHMNPKIDMLIQPHAGTMRYKTVRISLPSFAIERVVADIEMEELA